MPRIAGRASAGTGERNIFQVLQRVQTILRSLGCDRITHSILGIEPVGRRCLKASAKRNQQVGGNVALGEARQLRLRAIHVDMKIGFIEGLLDAQIGGARNHSNPAQEFVGKAAIGLKIITRDLNINRGRQTKVQDLAHDVGRQKSKSHAGKLLRQLKRRSWTYSSVGRWSGVKVTRMSASAGPDRRGVAVGQIDAAVGQPDVVDDAGYFAGRNLLADELSTRSQRLAVSSMRVPARARR